ncbi:MAG: citrulline utilization hydrolase CtlX [Ilyomonas sp.]
MSVASAILMVRPASFGYNTETAANNVFQSSVSYNAAEVQQKAVQEFDAFVETLRSKGIEVIVIEDTASPFKPDAVFPNNWFCTLEDGTVAIFPMFATNRRIERRQDLIDQLKQDYEVREVEDWAEYENKDQYLEGTGSMVLDHKSKIIYACISPRTNEDVLKAFAQKHDYTAFTFHAYDENSTAVYHTNVIMHLGDDYAVICSESIKDNVEKHAITKLLEDTGHEVISITLQQVHAYAGNMLQVKNNQGQKYTIISNQAFNSLTAEQKFLLEKHTTLLPIDITMIETVGGGSVRCMLAEIFLQKKHPKSGNT